MVMSNHIENDTLLNVPKAPIQRGEKKPIAQTLFCFCITENTYAALLNPR